MSVIKLKKYLKQRLAYYEELTIAHDHLSSVKFRFFKQK